MNTDNIKQEVLSVKLIGESIGYGHLMGIASALWRKMLKEKYGTVIGAFIPSIPDEISEDQQREIDIYDKIVNF